MRTITTRSGVIRLLRMFGTVVALATCGISTHASAQGGAYPNKSIRVLIPFGPGSATDIIARMVTDEMRQTMGQSFLIENRVGANGFIAAEAAARAPADGYTLFVTASTTHSTNPSLFKKLPYDPVKDFAPVGGLMQAYYTVTVNNDLPVRTLAELIAYLKANEGKTSFGWGATVSQLSGVSLLKRIGATATGVPYKSSPQAVVDLIGGQLTFVVQDITTALAHVKGNRVRALAVTSPQRIPDMPNVPTMEEAGLPGFTAETWVGMYAPAATPEPIIARLSSVLQTAVRSEIVKQKMAACCSSTPFPSTPAQFGEYVAKDRAYWAERIKDAGIQPE